jgi:carboxylesterase type B
MTTSLKSPFGTFQGKTHDAVTQYRGIKYASVKDQLSVPELVTSYGDDVIDATHFGYLSSPYPQHVSLIPPRPRAPAMDGCAFEQSTLIQCSIGAPEETPPMSGTECLNLNITVPNIEGKGLPVMVFVHGGGYMMGGNHWPQYDPSRLIGVAVKTGMPVIGVNIK